MKLKNIKKKGIIFTTVMVMVIQMLTMSLGYVFATTNEVGTGLKGTYYDNIDFTGTEVVHQNENINFSWGTAAPVNSISATSYSVKWVGQIQPLYSDKYTSCLCHGTLKAH